MSSVFSDKSSFSLEKLRFYISMFKMATLDEIVVDLDHANKRFYLDCHVLKLYISCSEPSER